MHSAGLELAKLTYTRLEDNLIRHRCDRIYPREGHRSVTPLLIPGSKDTCTPSTVYIYCWGKGAFCTTRHGGSCNRSRFAYFRRNFTPSFSRGRGLLLSRGSAVSCIATHTAVIPPARIKLRNRETGQNLALELLERAHSTLHAAVRHYGAHCNRSRISQHPKENRAEFLDGGGVLLTRGPVVCATQYSGPFTDPEIRTRASGSGWASCATKKRDPPLQP